MNAYPDLNLLIDGDWRPSTSGATLDVINPATEEVLGALPAATPEDLDAALSSAQRGFETWRALSPYARARILIDAANLVRDRAEMIATAVTLENGKPLAEARMEIGTVVDILEFSAEEGKRLHGRIVEGRAPGVRHFVVKEPVGVCLAITPWNFPINTVAKKLGAALGAGCSVILKASNETPASAILLVQALVDAGLPAGVVNVVFGPSGPLTKHLMSSDIVRKVSLTGSVPVGKQLAVLAAERMQRLTMELGGHAPVVVFDDVDIAKAVDLLVPGKFRNAGQICISPTRFFVQDAIYSDFVDAFTARAAEIKVGNGLEAGTMMGPLANARRLGAMDEFVEDARKRGATITTGGERIGNRGYFFAPTVIKDAPDDSMIMTEEPFGPMAPMTRFSTIEEVAKRANALELGLASYALTNSMERATRIGDALEVGMVGINTVGVAIPETPFGGVKESGYGVEGGPESLEHYVVPKSIAQKPFL
ncbi:NAD-dependent succinate-semialdehyde dehydrogenase [Marinovum sp. 2_MG-2023]|uniref:NAD-dependent succinate-semialdehyde dehydrogenase n=1 Tax=unclassified Marinovum TaxID=2647166 RepID=UPI0026E12E0B|nr:MULTISPECIES: NAD-dependent succinate-semialdehyde dehydrogenase [unclassified Marinovum]MDO6729853.1 NAD-dependent succinate-semialdehyde dehydrogenase [Marinovum sp. 2_MG-2023]MDO6779667.1 NAD-dependent succinate-semialdehyde dehydrogenase [Marinovum sp. 1_MG-2023]